MRDVTSVSWYGRETRIRVARCAPSLRMDNVARFNRSSYVKEQENRRWFDEEGAINITRLFYGREPIAQLFRYCNFELNVIPKVYLTLFTRYRCLPQRLGDHNDLIYIPSCVLTLPYYYLINLLILLLYAFKIRLKLVLGKFIFLIYEISNELHLSIPRNLNV